MSGPDAGREHIPFRVLVGVTGHRALRSPEQVAVRIDEALARIRSLVPVRPETPVVLDALSPIAEGADRLVAQRVLATPGAQLEVVLPLPVQSYLQDFAAEDLRDEFARLLSRSRRTIDLPPAPTREAAYERVGRYVVDECDVLVAVWDGKPAAGRGGTAEIVEYARRTRCPLVLVPSDGAGEIAFEPGANINLAAFERLHAFNTEPLNVAAAARMEQRERDALVTPAGHASIAEPAVRSCTDTLLPPFVRADALAVRYQRRYYRAGTALYLFASAAVAAAAFQALFAPARHALAWVETALVAGALALAIAITRGRWHAKWIDYRLLAERLRSGIFLAVAGVDAARLSSPRHVEQSVSPRDWVTSAFDAVWASRPVRTGAPAAVGQLRDLLLSAWLRPQIRYQDRTSARYVGRHRWLSLAGIVLFSLTFLAAVSHVVPGVPESAHPYFWYAAIVLPAFAAAVTAIRTHHECRRNADRAAAMARKLTELAAKMEVVRDADLLLQLARETEQTMLSENEEWRAVVRFSEIKAPV